MTTEQKPALEVVAWTADLEALMPEPFGYVPFAGEFYPPDELDAEVKNDPSVPAVFTADQVRQAMLDATERAAKTCELEVVQEVSDGDEAYNCAIRQCAAAIRGGGQG